MIFRTNDQYAPLVLRLLLGLVLFPHGAQKFLGWFGGFGFSGTMNYFTQTRQMPWVVGFLVILIEFFGPLALILGFGTRIWSAVIAVVMAGIILTTFRDYFFMNWFGNQKTEGSEFFLLAIGMSVSLVISGAGRHSVDSRISEKWIQE